MTKTILVTGGAGYMRTKTTDDYKRNRVTVGDGPLKHQPD